MTKSIIKIYTKTTNLEQDYPGKPEWTYLPESVGSLYVDHP